MREALGFIKVQRLTVKTRVLGIFQVSVNVSQNRGSFTCNHEKSAQLTSSYSRLGLQYLLLQYSRLVNLH